MDTSDPDRRAFALRYEPALDRSASHAPNVAALGSGWIADRILELARQHGVPVHEDRELVAMLSACDLDDEIPPQLTAAVAQLLVWLHRCDAELAERGG